MRPWKKVIEEAKSKREKDLEDKVSELEGIPSSLKKDKKEKSNKEKSDYTKYLEKQLEYKKQKYEDQKRRQIEKLKEREKIEKEKAGKKSFAKAKKALSGINIRKVGERESPVTATQKTAETAGSIVKGLTGAAVHGIAGLLKKRKAKKEAEERREKASSSQPEKKEPGKPGRPKKKGSKVSNEKSSSDTGFQDKLTGTPERKKITSSKPPSEGDQISKLPPISFPSRKKLPPAGPRRLPPSSDTSKSVAQRARMDPEFKRQEIEKRRKVRKENFSDWKTDFMIESGLLLEIGKNNEDKKKKIVDVMRGKNEIKINPSISEDHKEIASGKKIDDEGYMVNVELDSMERSIKSLRKKIKKSDHQLPAWVQSKITRATDYIDSASNYLQSDAKIDEENVNEALPALAAAALRVGASGALRAGAAKAAGASGRVAAKKYIKKKAKDAALEKVKDVMAKKLSGDTNQTGSGENPLADFNRMLSFSEAIDKDKMKCNKPKSDPVGDSKTGKSHVVKACEGGKKKIIRFGQKGVKGSPKKEGESEAYASRRKAFKDRHAKNIAKGKMSAAYWADKVKW